MDEIQIEREEAQPPISPESLDMTANPSKLLRPIVLGVSIVIIVIVGILLYRRSNVPVVSPGNFLSNVDRGLSTEVQAVMQKRIDDQLAEIAATEKEGKRDISQYLILGNAYYGIGDLANAMKAYRNILKTNPQDSPALQNLGQAQIEAGDYAGAQISWRAALKVEPDEGYYIRLADLIDQHDPANRATIGPLLDDAIATIGQTSNLLYRLGQWYEKNGKFNEALSHYQVAYQLSGQDASIKQVMEALQLKMSTPQ